MTIRQLFHRAHVSAAAIAALALVFGAWPRTASAEVRSVALFPVENLSGDVVPSAEVRQVLAQRLARAGVAVLDAAALDAFMARHRLRYVAGIDAPTAEALRRETNVDAVVIASVEFSSEAVPPKVCLIARVIALEPAPTVVWADDVGLAGNDRPGFFELRLVNEYPVLLARALDRIGDSLAAWLTSGRGAGAKRASKFRPKSAYRAVTLESGNRYSIAVVPFFNLSERRTAGDVLALLFVRHLSAFPQFRVIDTGVVRQQLLDARIIMDGGLAISDADTVAALIDADYVLGGRVVRYEDHNGAEGRTRVDFSTVLIEKKTRKVVWSSDSYNEGTDGVGFFERGISRTAHVMATQMVRLTAEGIAGGR